MGQDPAVADGGLIRELAREAGPVRVVGSPLRFASGPLPASSPPRLGQDNQAVLREAGFDDDAIEKLIAAGVIATD